ncbi:MAG: PLP-dependent aminotransferase family protein [Acidobacteriota bacterium]
MSATPQTPSAEAIDAKALATAAWLEGRGRSVLRQMVGLVAQPGVISLAGGLPDPALFPARRYGAAVKALLDEDPRALQYSPTFVDLKEQIVGIMKRRGVDCTVDQIFLTTGAQQGIDIATRLFLDPGDTVVLESLAYTGIHNTIAPYRPRVVTVETDLETGLNVDALERAFEQSEAALTYVIPDAHNPLGVSLSEEKRQRLVELVRHYGVPVLEDDPYGLLWYDEEFAPPLRARCSSHVLYLGSFSKILAPALRLGWIVVPDGLLDRLTLVKEATDLECSALTQRAVSHVLADGLLEPQLERIRSSYRERRDALLGALDEFMPAEARWTRPGGGMFVWLELPGRLDAFELLERSLEEDRVAFIPGGAFASDPTSGAGRHCARLSFATLEPKNIHEAVAKLAACIERSV